MLTNPIMGVVALAILWVNTLLIAGAAYQRFRALADRRARLVKGVLEVGSSGLFEGLVGGRAGAPIAVTTVEQLGRYGAGAGKSILWHDRAYASRALGGVLIVDGREAIIEPDPEAEVWPAPGALESAAACDSQTAFDAAFAAARKAKGFVRSVDARLCEGDRVWVFASVVDGANGLALERGAEPLLISAIDPRAWCSRQMAFLGALFIPAVLLGAAVCTAIALWPPHFGTVSTIGGALGFLYFLLVLPAGTKARDMVREPHQRILQGKWIDPEMGSPPEAASDTNNTRSENAAPSS